MQVVDKNSYMSSIYNAIVVNTNTDQDPENKGRVQIYIPSLNYEYADHYIEYMDSSDKASSKYANVFPWANTVISVEEGDNIYGSFIDGDGSKYIILGIDKNAPNIKISNANNTVTGDISSITASSITDLAMPIILHHEIGVSINSWVNDDIPDSKYSTIVLFDGGTWSLGLIQWNGVRAYDLCYNIAKSDSGWTNILTSNTSLKSALKQSINAGNTSSQRGSFAIHNPTKGGTEYNEVKNLLSSSFGKKAQRQMAYDDTAKVINDLMGKGCNNPAILIYMADFFNQYGSGYTETPKKCVEACSKGGDMMSQLDWLITNQLKPNFSSFNTYSNRRNATYSYVKDLYNNGKLTDIQNDLTNQGSNSSAEGSIAGAGTYCMPVKGHILISAGFGKSKNSGGQGYTNSSHNGMDFAIAKGTPIYAITSGNAVYSTMGDWGNHVFIYTEDDNIVVLAHMSAFKGWDRKVNKGEVVGYVGSTGNSTGDHVHVGITSKSNGTKGLYNSNVGLGKNPAPYLGIENRRDVYINV